MGIKFKEGAPEIKPGADKSNLKPAKIKKNQTGQRGGARKNAGRKKGSLSRKTRAIAERAVQEGVTPLEVMLESMEFHRNLALDAVAKNETEKASSAFKEAQAAAKDAAPFVHPRLAAVELSGPNGKPIEVSSPLDRIARKLEELAGSAPGVPSAT